MNSPHFVLVIWLTLFLAQGCASLPDQTHRIPSYKRNDTDTTVLAQRALEETRQHPGLSGVYPLSSGKDAFLSRVALIKLAQESLDLQYYIWHRDTTGTLLSAYLVEAADRGVRVRLLLDDLGSPLGDEILLLMSKHPNIEVRLFNPVASRTRRMLSLAADFSRTNRRMHNKSLTADNTLTIVGGRNIGDEYFGANSGMAFADLDVVAIGPVVDQASDSFDLYWNYTASYPVESLSAQHFSEDAIQEAREEMDALKQQNEKSDYVEQVRLSELLRNPEAMTWYWGEARLVYDPPEKADDSAVSGRVLLSQLGAEINAVSSELIVVSPYFIPGQEGVRFFRDLVQRGVKVIILTNSLAATDVGAVHSGYAKYRKSLLEAGVGLYEVRPDAAQPTGNKTSKSSMLVGSGKASLHAKAFFMDRRTTFVGSLNLDPRSVNINTEVGLVIVNEELTSAASDAIQTSLTQNAYRLELDKDGNLTWLSDEEGEVIYHDHDPGVSALRRFGVWFMSLFPVESQL